MKNLTSIYILAILLTLFSCRDEAVEPELFGQVKGEVLFAEDLTPMANVQISTNPSSEIILTDSLGQFTFESLPVGEYSIKAEMEGYTNETISVIVDDFQTSDVVIQMDVRPSSNDAPIFSETIYPEHGAENQAINFSFSWEAHDPEVDEILYELWIFEEELTNGVAVVKDYAQNSFEITDLKYSTTYFWQVVAYDAYNDKVESPIWQFKTEAAPEHRLLFVREIQNQLHLMCSDFENTPIKITSGNAHYWRPKLSPNRDKIAFISSQNVETHLFTMDIDGTNWQQVTSLPITGADPFKLDYCWSPDGSQLLYMHFDKLYKINQNGTGLSLFAETGNGHFFTTCDWNEQTNQIVALTTGTNPYDNEIYLFDEAGNATLAIENVPGTLGSPSLSIDGKHLLYTHDISEFENINGRQLDAHIFLLNLETLTSTDLSINKLAGMNDLNPRFSPNGAQVIFTYTSNDGISQRNIWIMDLDGEHREWAIEDGEMADWQ